MAVAAVGVLAQFDTVLAGLAWRATGVDALGRRLVRRADSQDDDVRRLALMALISAGDRGVDQVTDAYECGSTSTSLPQVLISLGTPRARDALTALTSNSVEQVRTAAEQALTELAEIERYRDDRSTS